MPRTKRPLAEVDPNALKSQSKRTKETESPKANKDYESMWKTDLVKEAKAKNIPHTGSKQILAKRLRKAEQDGEPVSEERVVMEPSAVQKNQSSMTYKNTLRVLNSIDKRGINYYTKDHEKLVTILRDRQLSTEGTREEMIKRLEENPANYGLRTSAELTQILRQRRAPGNVDGKKAIKIASVMLNDEIDRDTGNDVEKMIFEKLFMLDESITEFSNEREAILEENAYENSDDAELKALLEEKVCYVPEDREEMIEALLDEDVKEFDQEILSAEKERSKIEALLSRKVDRPVSAKLTIERETKLSARASLIMQRISKALEQDEHTDEEEPTDEDQPTCQTDTKSSEPLWTAGEWTLFNPHLLVHVTDEILPPDESVSGDEEESRVDDGIDYTTKDNSKLQVILRDRGLPDNCTREEMITLLQRNPPNYDQLTSDEISDLLRGRHSKYAASGTKANKIERLIANDALDRDAANYGDMKLWVRLEVLDSMLDESEGNPYNKTPLDPKRRKELQADFDSKKAELEERVGHPVVLEKDWKKADFQWHGREDKIYREGEQAKTDRPAFPTCDYDWSDSHWASRDERNLREICDRRGMPGGSGTKAGMLKWLDTGVLDYTGLYMSGLERICRDRGITHKATAKKADLIALLEEDDKRKEEE